MATGYVGVTEGEDKKIATHSFSEDGTTKHVERVAPGVGVITLPTTPQISGVTETGLYPTDPINVEGKSRIVLKTLYEDSSNEIAIRGAFYDSSGNIIGYSEEVSIGNQGIAEGSYYLGDVVVFSNDAGAKEFKVKVTNITGGTAHISVGSW